MKPTFDSMPVQRSFSLSLSRFLGLTLIKIGFSSATDLCRSQVILRQQTYDSVLLPLPVELFVWLRIFHLPSSIILPLRFLLFLQEPFARVKRVIERGVMKRSRRSRSSSSFSLFLLLLFSFVCTLTFAQTQQTFNHDLPSNSISSTTNDQDESHSNQTWLSRKDQESLQRLMLTPPTTLPITNPIVIPLKSTFSPERVCLSFLVSFIGSITCLELLLKMSPRLSRKDREERQDTQSQASEISSSSNSSNTVKSKSKSRDYFNLHNHSWMWLLGAAFAFGGGTTWAMHFISKSPSRAAVGSMAERIKEAGVNERGRMGSLREKWNGCLN